MNDNLGNRMKTQYENRVKHYLPRRTYTIIRIDGKAFHTYTRGLTRPFDEQFCNDMDSTALYLCENVQGAKFAYVQSDEISLLLTDFDKIETQAWFDGNVQKMVSISASLATGWFNGLRPRKLAFFDSRVFTIPDPTEVVNYFIWRQKDCVRNSIQAVAQSLYSQKQLNGKSSNELQELIFQKNQNWNDYYAGYKRGRFVQKGYNIEGEDTLTWGWNIIIPPIFTQERLFLEGKVPKYE